jgi:hypothetical protein
MSQIKVVSNRHWRDFTSWDELTTDEQSFHDYADAGDTFVRYKGMVEHLGSFVHVHPLGELFSAGWDGATADSAWSGWVIRVNREHDAFQVGRWMQTS